MGTEIVLAGDLLPQINQIIREHGAKIPPHELERQKKVMLKSLLDQAIQTKLAYLDFLRTVPADRIDSIRETINEQFDETELSKAIEKANVQTPAELDAKLREFGSSLEKQRRTFAEQVLAKEMIRQNVKRDEEVTHDQMLAYYREHQPDYYVPAKAKWEQLESHFDKFPSKAEAYEAMVEMGNKVLRGAPFAEVARRHSHGLCAKTAVFTIGPARGASARKNSTKRSSRFPSVR